MIKRSARLARLKMKTPTLLLRISGLVLGVFGVTVVLLVGGCRKSATSFNPETPSQPAPIVQPGQNSAAQDDTARREDAKHAVIAYLTALKNGKYPAAYEMLSRDSKDAHSSSDFERQGRQGMPPFDLDSAKVIDSGKETVVQVTLIEDPSSHGFYLVREDDAWKIVYRGGIPTQPYAE